MHSLPSHRLGMASVDVENCCCLEKPAFMLDCTQVLGSPADVSVITLHARGSLFILHCLPWQQKQLCQPRTLLHNRQGQPQGRAHHPQHQERMGPAGSSCPPQFLARSRRYLDGLQGLQQWQRLAALETSLKQLVTKLQGRRRMTHVHVLARQLQHRSMRPRIRSHKQTAHSVDRRHQSGDHRVKCQEFQWQLLLRRAGLPLMTLQRRPRT
mmetsp:Transcript_134961/g.269326  ORF Transcript_134961/g.269326 Transcript_134961/m.269326 type:complete len:211 (+) Transcript_134961:90-722(+)